MLPSPDWRTPARYLPFADGRYVVRPGLHRLGTDFGNGQADQQVFQVDRDFAHYRAAKLAARGECLHRHVITRNYGPSVAQAVARFVAHRVAEEHPCHFLFHNDGKRRSLECRLTGEQLLFDEHGQLDSAQGMSATEPPYVSCLDALISQVQEDAAVICVDGNRHWLAALHVCLPSHWSPQQKIGRTFAQVHALIPGMAEMNRGQRKYVQQMVSAEDGLVRFTWGLQIGPRLSCHPDARPGAACRDSQDCRFDPNQARVYVRVERQTIWGLPAVGASLFTIRPYLMDVATIRSDLEMCRALISALGSMSAATVAYKGLATWRDDLVAWLSSAVA